MEQNHAVLALFPPSYDYIFLPVCLAGTAAAALALGLVGALYLAEGAGRPVPPLRLEALSPPSAPAAGAAALSRCREQQQVTTAAEG